jgi:beta-galactosidase
VNYADRLGEAKGLIGPVTLDGAPVTGWTATPVVLDAASGAGTGAGGRALLRGRFSLETPGDLFLDTSVWGKGYAFVNGFFLGRYWSTVPQRTLYVPAPATRAGVNELVVLELEHAIDAIARIVSAPSLGQVEE